MSSQSSKHWPSYASKVFQKGQTERVQAVQARTTAPRAALASVAPVPSVPTTLSKPLLPINIPLLDVKLGSTDPAKQHGTSAARAIDPSGSGPVFVIPKLESKAGAKPV